MTVRKIVNYSFHSYYLMNFHYKITLFYLMFVSFIQNVQPVVNKYHNIYEGTSNAAIIGGDTFFEIIDPPELKYTYRIRPARDFGTKFNSSNVLKNIPLVPISPKNGCTFPNNAEDIEGNVAFIQRGHCTFKMKTLIAEKAGARAAIITDEDYGKEDYFIGMMDDTNTEVDVNIPAAYLLGKNGVMIRKALEKLNRNYAIINLPVNLTFTPIHKVSQPPWLEWL